MTDDDFIRGNPIQKSEEDLLDREKIVNHLSNLIVKDSVNDCCTIGIIGKWGSGKSSVINLIEEKVNKLTEEQKRTFFIRFNPIDYSTNAESISRIFFEVLITNLKKIHKDHPEMVGTYKKNKWKIFKHSANTIADAAKEVPDFQGIIDNLENLANAIINPASQDPIETVKAKISDMLSNAKLRIIVIIDDIDRLDPDEAVQILKLIRVTADFKNVFYILAYDEKVFSEHINEKMGHDYLEKFIQVPVRLPELNGAVVKKMLYDHYAKSIAKYEFAVNDYTAKAFESIRISTMRDLYILMNRFNIKMAMCPKDICPEDLLLLTIIEMKDPDLADWMFKNRFNLCSTRFTFINDGSTQELQESSMMKIVDKPEMKDNVEDALKFLFPYLYGSYIDVKMDELRKDHIHSYQSCNIYYMLTVSSIAVSNEVIDYILKSENRMETFSETCSDLIRNSLKRYNPFLEKVILRLNEFEYLDRVTIAKTLLFDDKIIESELADYFSLDSSLQYPAKEALLDLVFEEMDDSEIEDMFNNDLPDDSAYALAMDYTYLHGLSIESKSGRKLPMSQECFEKITKKTADKFSESSHKFKANDDLYRTRLFLVFLSLANSDAAKNEFDRLFDNDDSVIEYVEYNFKNGLTTEVVDELAKYIPKERISSLAQHTDKYNTFFTRVEQREK